MTTGRINLVAIVVLTVVNRHYNCEANLGTHTFIPFRGGNRDLWATHTSCCCTPSLGRVPPSVRSFNSWDSLEYLTIFAHLSPGYGSRGAFGCSTFPRKLSFKHLVRFKHQDTDCYSQLFVLQRNNFHQGFHTSSRLSLIRVSDFGYPIRNESCR